MRPNKMLMPVNNLSFNETGISEFNQLYQYCLEQESAGDFGQITFTKSGGISVKYHNLRGPMWGMTIKKTLIELIIRDFEGYWYRFIIGHNKDKKNNLSGRQAWWKYQEMLRKHNININELAISDGQAVKETIPSPRIELVAQEKVTYYNVHHIDLNSAYNAGMMKAFPILEPAIREMYNKRKEIPEYKEVLNMTQGFMQSQLVDYRFSHISKAGYVYTLNKLDELTEKLTAAGNTILSYNTDGIWYTGNLYHDSDEGFDIGQWKHDYKNCKIRFKSKGCYEFMTADGIYKPVFRGESTFERIVPREDWIWGDIFRGDTIMYKFIEGVGLVND